MYITDGKGRGYVVEVNELNQIVARAVVQHRPAYISESLGRAFTVYVNDAGPAAGEYIVWLQNDSETPIIINTIFTFNVDANVVWLLHKVTGTGATAAVLTPQNLNMTSGNDALVTARGGAGGVTGLTSSGVITGWGGGVAYFNSSINWWTDAITLGKNDAIAVEYDAGTGSRASVTIMFHNQA